MAEEGQYPPRQAQSAQWAKKDRFRMRYGASALIIGWLGTFLLFCLGLTVANLIAEGPHGLGAGFFFLAVMFGFPVALLAGLPLAVLLAWPLRRVRDQRLHVVAFALAMGVVATGAVLFFYAPDSAEMGGLMVALILWTAACGAIGRASVIKLVTRRNPLVPGGLEDGLSRTDPVGSP
ncbi:MULTISPECIES: hypothetical protein [Arthrobacter]|uniref:Uncharacterized protein n=1 Tax=Arthrobacter psychrochitiniphilus TaxID=291045 RepID=A0A2V3DVU9_9MICC|nr:MULTISPECIES: hypothetical protein [Arthrobacter]NYG16338.1 glucan phosphoethanolaminetransferase (alkaline phosphatase superfamily) [Arthrobacter psychrochitiniphilus]PXA69498.1 hypothetical protein CVS29_02850 [Arthrobacter psychrochitiniphilus]